MIELFDYIAEPLRGLLTSGEVSAEVGELFLAALAWFVPVVLLVFFCWAVFALLRQFLGLGGADC